VFSILGSPFVQINSTAFYQEGNVVRIGRQQLIQKRRGFIEAAQTAKRPGESEPHFLVLGIAFEKIFEMGYGLSGRFKHQQFGK
jgi:hypothetical protein